MKAEVSKGFFVAIGFLLALLVWGLMQGLISRGRG